MFEHVRKTGLSNPDETIGAALDSFYSRLDALRGLPSDEQQDERQSGASDTSGVDGGGQ